MPTASSADGIAGRRTNYSIDYKEVRRRRGEVEREFGEVVGGVGGGCQEVVGW